MPWRHDASRFLFFLPFVVSLLIRGLPGRRRRKEKAQPGSCAFPQIVLCARRFGTGFEPRKSAALFLRDKGFVDHLHRAVGVLLVDDDRDFDLTGGDHLDIDAGVGQRLKHLGRDAGIGGHAGPDD